jgi:hypothetical protein
MKKTVELLVDRLASEQELQGLFVKYPDLKRLLRPDYMVRRDKTGSFYVRGYEEEEAFELGLGLFITISRKHEL